MLPYQVALLSMLDIALAEEENLQDYLHLEGEAGAGRQQQETPSLVSKQRGGFDVGPLQRQQQQQHHYQGHQLGQQPSFAQLNDSNMVSDTSMQQEDSFSMDMESSNMESSTLDMMQGTPVNSSNLRFSSDYGGTPSSPRMTSSRQSIGLGSTINRESSTASFDDRIAALNLHTQSIALDLISPLQFLTAVAQGDLSMEVRQGTFASLDQALRGVSKGSLYASAIKDKIGFLVSIEHLFAFFEQIEGHLVTDEEGKPPLVDRASVIGVYIRKNILMFRQLSFKQLNGLFKALKVYTTSSKDIEHKSLASSSPFSTSLLAKNDSNRYLLKQIGEGSKQNNEMVTSSLSESGPLSIFIKFVRALEEKRVVDAIDLLHHYFDVQVYQASKTAARKIEREKEDPQAKKRTFFHNASLMLASTYRHVGFSSLALQGVLEAIRVAQEYSDKEFLLDAMGWMSRLGGVGDGSDLVRLFAQASSGGDHPLLHGSALLALAQQHVARGEDPSTVFGLLDQVLSLSSLPSHSSSSSLSNPRVLARKRDSSELVAMYYTMMSATWSLYGNMSLSALYAQLGVVQGEPLTASPSEVCACYCKLAVLHNMMGNFAVSNELIDVAASLYPLQHHAAVFWQSTRCHLQILHAIYTRNFKLGFELAEQLAAFDLSDTPNDDPLYLEALLYKEQGLLDSALAVAISLRGTLRQNLTNKTSFASSSALNSVKLARIELLIGEICLQSRQYSIALAHVLQAEVIAQETHCSAIILASNIAIAEIQLQLGLASRAVEILDSSMAAILSSASLYTQARAHLVLAQATLLNASTPRSPQVLEEVISMFEEALGLASRLDALSLKRECLYNMAHAANVMGDIEKRNLYSSQFVQIDSLFSEDA